MQETFLPKQEGVFSNSIDSRFTCISSSPVDLGCTLIRGRPYGGLAFLIHEEISPFVKKVATNDERLLCIDVVFNSTKTRIINCYMPYFNGFNTEMYLHELGKLNCLFTEHENDHVIALGDFNAHISSEFGSELLGWCDEYDCCAVDINSLPIDTHTWVSDATGHTRWLDHVVCPKTLVGSVSSFKVLYEEIGSDHKPLGFKLYLNNSYERSVRNFLYNKVSYEVKDKENYYQCSEEALKQLKLPVEALICKTVGCRDRGHFTQIQAFAMELINALIQSGDTKVIGSVKNLGIAGWNEHVKPYHDIARQKYLSWKDMGMPRAGTSYNEMILSKRNLKKALRDCKTTNDLTTRNKIARDMKKKNPWKTINKVRKKVSSLPLSINGVEGEKNIAECWRNHYATIMEGKGHPKLSLSVENISKEWTIPKVLVKEVQLAMKNLSIESAPGLDGVTGDHLRYAHPTLYVHLSLLFSSLFGHHFVTQNLIDIKILNLVKDNHKSLSDMNNYRPIALASLVSKLLECIILERCKNLLTTSDNQFAYKSKHSTDMALFLFKQISEQYKSKNTPVFVCAMDMSKAFDRVCHERLFNILEKRQVPFYIISLLKYWYREQEFRVLWGNSLSSSFRPGCGIRQGSILSAILFAVYMDDLSKELNGEGGCIIGDTKINHIFYADDILLLAPSLKALQALIDKTVKYLDKNYLTVNAQKTKVLVVKPKNFILYGNPILYINNVNLEVVNSYKYLGMSLNDNLKDDAHIATLYRGQCLRGNLLVRNFSICNQESKIHLFKAFCTSLYCIPLSLDCKKETLRKLQVCYNDSFRYLMGIPRSSRISGYFVSLRLPSFEELVRKNIVSLFERLKDSNNRMVKAIFYSEGFKKSLIFNKWSERIFCNI